MCGEPKPLIVRRIPSCGSERSVTAPARLLTTAAALSVLFVSTFSGSAGIGSRRVTFLESRSTTRRAFSDSAVTSATGVPPWLAASREAAGTGRIASNSSALFTPPLRLAGRPESLRELDHGRRVEAGGCRGDRPGLELDHEVNAVREARPFPARRRPRGSGQSMVRPPRQPRVLLQHRDVRIGAVHLVEWLVVPDRQLRLDAQDEGAHRPVLRLRHRPRARVVAVPGHAVVLPVRPPVPGPADPL